MSKLLTLLLTLLISLSLTGCDGATTSDSVVNTVQLISKVESIEPPSKGGCIENTYDFTYDTSGNVIGKVEKNYDGNCELARVEIFTYDISGNTIKVDLRSILGDTNYIIEYQYNAHNHLIKKNKDNDANGTVDEIGTYVNTYDAEGNRLTESVDYTTDGIVDYIATWIYNEDGTGNPISKSEDYNADGAIDFILNYIYDSNNNKLIEFVDHNADSTWDSMYVWTYDENNNITNESSDQDADGVIDRIESNFVMVRLDVKEDVPIGNSVDTDGNGIIDRDFIVTTRDSNNNVTEARYEESGVLGKTWKIYWDSYTIQ